MVQLGGLWPAQGRQQRQGAQQGLPSGASRGLLGLGRRFPAPQHVMLMRLEGRLVDVRARQVMLSRMLSPLHHLYARWAHRTADHDTQTAEQLLEALTAATAKGASGSRSGSKQLQRRAQGVLKGGGPAALSALEGAVDAAFAQAAKTTLAAAKLGSDGFLLPGSGPDGPRHTFEDIKQAACEPGADAQDLPEGLRRFLAALRAHRRDEAQDDELQQLAMIQQHLAMIQAGAAAGGRPPSPPAGWRDEECAAEESRFDELD